MRLALSSYEMFTGKLPHRSSTASNQPAAKPGTPMEKIPSEWQPIIKKCMAYDPADRYATVDEVWGALIGDQHSPGRRRFLESHEGRWQP